MENRNGIGPNSRDSSLNQNPTAPTPHEMAASPFCHGIHGAIEQLLAKLRSRGGPEIEFYDDIPLEELPVTLHSLVIVILRELLANACQHSHSPNVLVGLGREERSLYIQVQDWGVGFDSARGQTRGRGLKDVYALTKQQGGSVTIESVPGAGTCALVELPLPPKSIRRGPQSSP